MKKLHEILKLIFFLFFMKNIAIAHASNFMDYKIGMSSKDAHKFGIYKCNPDVLKDKYYEKPRDVTKCEIKGDDSDEEYQSGLIYFDNKTKKIVKIKAEFNPVFLKKISLIDGKKPSEVQKMVEDAVLVKFKMKPCEKMYFKGGWNEGLKTCLYHPDVVRTISSAFMDGKNMIIKIKLPILIEIRVDEKQYKDLLERSIAIKRSEEFYKNEENKRKNIANEIQSGK